MMSTLPAVKLSRAGSSFMPSEASTEGVATRAVSASSSVDIVPDHLCRIGDFVEQLSVDVPSSGLFPYKSVKHRRRDPLEQRLRDSDHGVDKRSSG
jgi:hypothetical protein